MKIILFGATGMVGQGALRECLLDSGVEEVLVVGRSPVARTHAKLREIVHRDLTNYSAIESELIGYDACFFCLGISSAGLTEQQYRAITFDVSLAAAQVLARLNPRMVFIFVSGAGADSTGRSRTMWARVKGETENALLRLPFRAAYVFRPAVIQPLYGIQSKTGSYRKMYVVLTPLFPLLKAIVPNYVTTTEHLGKAMIQVARTGFSKPVLESRDIASVITA